METIIAKTIQGLDEVLLAELKFLGVQNPELIKRGVRFKADKAMLYKVNLHSRVAIRFMQELHVGTVRNQTDLYKVASQVSWNDWFEPPLTFAVDAVVHSSYFNHSGFVALKTKDAIVDQFRKKIHKRPSVDPQRPDIRIHVHLNEDQCTILLDSSGEPLNKRGYRLQANIAPLNEVLAAGMIMLSGWDGTTNFVDTMCGSGTLLVEAAMFALKIPPGIFRNDYTFTNWANFDEALWLSMRKQASIQAEMNTRLPIKIVGGDISPKAVGIAMNNIRRAKLEQVIEVQKIPFSKFTPPANKGTLIINPPYDERMEVDKINQLYKETGDNLKRNFANWDAWILSANEEAMKNVELRPSAKHILYNGTLQCKFNKYELYEGSKKQKNVEETQPNV